MSATEHRAEPGQEVEEIAQTNPGVDAAKVREAQEMLRELRKSGRRRDLPTIGSPYGVRVRKNPRGFGTTYG